MSEPKDQIDTLYEAPSGIQFSKEPEIPFTRDMLLR